MSTTADTLPGTKDLLSQQPDLERLCWVLEKNPGFGLYFARCNVPVYRQRLTEAIKSRLSRPVREVELVRSDDTAMDQQVSAALGDTEVGAAVFVYGLDRLLSEAESEEERERLLNELNWRRNAYARLERPVVFWVSDFALDGLAREAPDFYDWRSGVYEFDTSIQRFMEPQCTVNWFLDIDENDLGKMNAYELDGWRNIVKETLKKTGSSKSSQSDQGRPP